MIARANFDKEPQAFGSLRKDSDIILPDEYDMFSELHPSLFTDDTTPQRKWIVRCLTHLKESLKKIYKIYGGNKFVLPKMIYSKDNEDAIGLNMASPEVRASITFEGPIGNWEAYTVIVARLDDDSFSHATATLTLENYQTKLDAFLGILMARS